MNNKLEVKGDANNRVELALVADDGTRIVLKGVRRFAMLAEEPYVLLTTYIRAIDAEIDLPEQTGELLKVVAKLEAEVDRLREERSDLMRLLDLATGGTDE